MKWTPEAFVAVAAALSAAAVSACGGTGPGVKAYVSNERDGTVTVIDTATDTVDATVRVGARPRGLVVAPDGRTLYVATSDESRTTAGEGDGIVAIETRRNRVGSRYPAGSDPEQFALGTNPLRFYASNEDAGTASVIDVASRRVLTSLLVGIEPEGAAISPDGRWVYITAETSSTVSVIDTRAGDGEVAHTFMVDVRPRAVAFAPDGRRAYVSAEIGGTLAVVDTGRHEVIGTIDLDERRAKPVGVAVSPDSRRVYVANGHGHSVSVVDAASMRETAVVPVGRRPWGVAITPDGRKVYTANGLSNDVSVIDTASNRVVATIPAGEGPWGVAVGR